MSDRGLDRRPGGKDEFLSDEDAKRHTEAYVRICMFVIMNSKSVSDLRRWYKEERDERFERYGLTHRQIDRIIAACRDQVDLLEGRARKVA